MKRVALGAMGMALSGFAVLGFAASAEAADMYAPRAPYTVNQPLNAYSWAGPYLGGNIGYAWGSVDNNPTNPGGLVGGVQGGYNWQSGPVVFGVGKIRLGDVICYEVAFDHLVRSEVTAGANLLAVQSNDADFEIDGQLGETQQQTAMARIRAVESDRAVVYASTTGESTIIAPDGSLVAHSGVWQQAILDARVPLVSHRTLADRVGAWPEYVIIMLTVLALAWAVVRVTRQRRPASV